MSLQCPSCDYYVKRTSKTCYRCGKELDTSHLFFDKIATIIIIIMTFFIVFMIIYVFIKRDPIQSINQTVQPIIQQIIDPEIAFKNNISEVIKKDWSEKMKKKCINVFLVKESNNIYRGYAEFSDKTKIKVKVTTDGNQTIYVPELF